MKNIFLLVLLSAALVSCSGEEAKPANKKDKDQTKEAHTAESTTKVEWDRKFFRGLIDDQYEIYLVLDNQQGQVTGKYYYTSQRKMLDLSGFVNETGLNLKESYKGKITGAWSGEIADDYSFFGDWTGNGNEFSLAFSVIDSMDFYVPLSVREKEVIEVSWEDFISSFPTKDFPFEILNQANEADGSGGLDTLAVQQFIYENYSEEEYFGYNNFIPVFKVETEFGYMVGLHHFFTPGAFGIYDTYFIIVTYDQEGNQIDNSEIGCYCYDSNMGSNDFYETDIDATFNKDEILISGVGIHATLFEEEEFFEDGELVEPFHHEETFSSVFVITEDGYVQKKEGIDTVD